MASSANPQVKIKNNKAGTPQVLETYLYLTCGHPEKVK